MGIEKGLGREPNGMGSEYEMGLRTRIKRRREGLLRTTGIGKGNENNRNRDRERNGIGMENGKRL